MRIPRAPARSVAWLATGLAFALAMPSGSAIASDPASATVARLVTSAGPEKVSVTVYRAPGRAAGQPIDRAAPDGFALISETRTIALPAGRSVIRFEGVAGNIFPETAILGGLPGDVREKNLDADLLSPRSLYDRALGRRVIIRRTNPKTGKVTEEQATIRSSAAGAAVLTTGAGNEALRCSGLPEKILYDSLPPDLSAKPTLSIETDSPVARKVTITLSYLAGGFDWQANYVANLSRDGLHADLFAWVTLASNDVTSFADAQTQVVAGRVNREAVNAGFGQYSSGALALQCWPDPDYASHAVVYPPPPPSPVVSAPMVMRGMVAQDIVVTGARKAVQEELGDLKLYRITDPVTVASKGQKQVAFLSNNGVAVTPVYANDIYGAATGGAWLTLRSRNRKDQGLGLPLPSGQIQVFEAAAGRPILVGQSSTGDKAVGEDVEFRLASSSSVVAQITMVESRNRIRRYRLVVTNANPRTIAYEAKFHVGGGAAVTADGAKLGRRDGLPIWAVAIPANGSTSLDYTITLPR